MLALLEKNKEMYSHGITYNLWIHHQFMKKTKQILWYCKVVFWQHSCQCLSDFLKSRNWAFTIFSKSTLIWSIWDCIRLKVCTTIFYNLLVKVIARFVVIFGINTTSDISKLLYVISWAVRRVKFEAILKYHKWYLCQISHTNPAIICLYHYPQRVCNFHM